MDQTKDTNTSAKEEVLQSSIMKKEDAVKAKPKLKSKFSKKGKFDKNKHVSSKKINDAQWYVPNEQLAKDAGNIPFYVYVGSKYTLSNDSTIDRGGIPGIFTYRYVPAIGKTSPTSAINMAMRAIYTYVRHANAGHTNYEAPDLMLYILAMDSIYLQVHEITRILKLAYSYHLGNRLIPEAIYASLGINLPDVVSNLANWRAQLNQVIAKINTLAVPKDFDLFKRRAMLGNLILTDEPNKPTQIILPVADCYYRYNPLASGGGRLEAVSSRKNATASPLQVVNNDSTKMASTWYRNVGVTLQYLFDILNASVSVLLADEDINIMSGDILKAYGSNIYQLNYIEENVQAEYSHDENVLAQFANAVTIDIATATIDYSPDTQNYTPLKFIDQTTAASSDANATSAYPMIGQRNGTLLFGAQLVFPSVTSGTTNLWEVACRPFTLLKNAPIRVNKSETSPAENLEVTRLTMLSVTHNGSSSRYDIVHGTEIGLGWTVFTPDTITNNVGNPSMRQWLQFSGIIPKAVGPSGGGINMSCVETKISDGYKQYFTNDLTVHNAMLGLSNGPLHYVLGLCSFSNRSFTPSGVFSISKSSERTALIDSVTLSTMHDVALLGLLKTQYYSSGLSKNK